MVGNNIDEQFDAAAINYCDQRLVQVGHALIQRHGGSNVRVMAIPIEDVLERGDEAIVEAVREITGSAQAEGNVTKH